MASMTMTPWSPGRIPPGVRAVFFDAVGTLIHPHPQAADAYFEVGRRFGSRLDRAVVRRRFTAAFRAQETADSARESRTSEERELERWRLIVAAVLDDVSDPEGCFRALHAHFAEPAAWSCETGAAEVVAALRAAGYRVGLASNFDHRLHGLARVLPGLAGVEPVVISSEVGWKKPSPRFFAHLAERTGLAPEQVLLVGDDVDNDIGGARGAGMHALLFDPRDAHPDCPPGERIRDLQELIAASGLPEKRTQV
jgi:putative hydrolase of the HAD superfamily